MHKIYSRVEDTISSINYHGYNCISLWVSLLEEHCIPDSKF